MRSGTLGTRAETLRGITPEDLPHFRWLEELALSPDGQSVAYTVKRVDLEADGYQTDLYVQSAQVGPVPPSPRKLSPGGGTAASPGWVTNPNVRVIRRLRYKMDGPGFVHDRYRHIVVLELESGDLTPITGGELDHFEPAWSRSGQELGFIAEAREQNTELGQGQVFTCRYPGGRPEPLLPGWQAGEWERVVAGKAVVFGLSPSADGTRIAYGSANPAQIGDLCLWEAAGATTQLTSLNPWLQSRTLPYRKSTGTPASAASQSTAGC